MWETMILQWKYNLMFLYVNIIVCASENLTFSQEEYKCSLPDVTTVDSELDIARFRTDFSKISEVKFPGLIGPLNERLICKIKCIDGNWVGPLCSTTEDGRFQPVLRECVYKKDHQLLLISFKNTTIEKETNFPHGSVISARCRKFGLYKLQGETTLRCDNGEWSPRFPECVPTTLITNFTGDAPPTIEYVLVSGSATVEPSGELYVYPESTLHLDCVVKRSAGQPDWSWTQMLGQHSVGWSEAAEPDGHYRLTLSKASFQHSDNYTCTAAHGQTNTVVVQVVSVSCPRVNVSSDHLTFFEEGVRLGQSVHFSCQPGYHLNGSTSITCMGSGAWSGAAGECLATRCPRLPPLGAHLSVAQDGRGDVAGGRALFACAWGFRLRGAPGLECGLDGLWSGAPPVCDPIYCPAPVVPEHGRVATAPPEGKRREGKYAVGDLVIYGCAAQYEVRGEASIVCTESGQWSQPPPFCLPPGDLASPDTIVIENTTLVHVQE